MKYPEFHQQIVTTLLEGKFITQTDDLFYQLKKEEEFYVNFFKSSFGFDLHAQQEFYYLISNETNETTSRNFSIFFSILCFELDKQGKNFIDELNEHEFSLVDFVEIFNHSTWQEVIKINPQLNSEEGLKSIMNQMMRRNIVQQTKSNTYQFTKAYLVFIDFARSLVRSNEKSS